MSRAKRHVIGVVLQHLRQHTRGNAKLVHPRTDYRHLRPTGIPACRWPVAAKHRYAYVLDPAWRWRLVAEHRPYPKLLAGESRR